MEQKQKTVGDVQFDEQSYDDMDRKITSKNHSKMAGWLMKHAGVETERRANIILVGVALLFFLLSILVLVVGASSFSSDSYTDTVQNLQDSSTQ